MSYTYNVTRVGNAILCIMDFSDILLSVTPPPLSEVVWLRYTDGFRVDGENAELFGITTSV
jgi:hypothetical protein